MADDDEQEEPHKEADRESDESSESEDERTAEQIGEELVECLDELDASVNENTAELVRVNEQLEQLRAELASYARAEHEHPHEHEHEHEQYARGDHEHAEAAEHEPGSGAETGGEGRRESAPRSHHVYYRPFPPWKH